MKEACPRQSCIWQRIRIHCVGETRIKTVETGKGIYKKDKIIYECNITKSIAAKENIPRISVPAEGELFHHPDPAEFKKMA